ncbi:hypothetical protein SAMN04488510_12234 [Fervidobacterium changbaicum]|uniref:Uncharacterized protein n=2 Tax=Fervidobacterium TaxID=2422 RepID=A0AAI8CM54_FERIS|nr:MULTISPECIES: hypothetical protein [Fervidobacterium]AMW33482.1 hypothetical protein NA23_09740 [Fervidobacterium islandicum]QAV33536.1 hypothetical protein CBS1_07260 [Fervidobacterium changbaicum]SDH63310.1 hypothetical protein SAMN04488510_12234 [Fervidobacterium changbaicum]
MAKLKSKATVEMIKSLVALFFLIVLYPWSAEYLHLGVFLLDPEVFNFFLLYLPTLVFFSSLFLNLEETFQEVQRLVVYAFAPIFAFRLGWYGLSFHYGYVVCYIISNFVKPKFQKRFPIIIFNGLALLLLLTWRAS